MRPAPYFWLAPPPRPRRLVWGAFRLSVAALVAGGTVAAILGPAEPVEPRPVDAGRAMPELAGPDPSGLLVLAVAEVALWLGCYRRRDGTARMAAFCFGAFVSVSLLTSLLIVDLGLHEPDWWRFGALAAIAAVHLAFAALGAWRQPPLGAAT